MIMSINKINTLKTRNELETYRKEINEAIKEVFEFTQSNELVQNDFNEYLAEQLKDDEFKKEVKKGLRELETTFNTTARMFDGNLKFASGVDEDPESNARSWDLDI